MHYRNMISVRRVLGFCGILCSLFQGIAAASPADISNHAGGGDYCAEIRPLVNAVARKIPSSNSKSTPFAITGFPEDGRYGVPLNDFWNLTEECLHQSGFSGTTIHVRNLPGTVPLRAYLKDTGVMKANGSANPSGAWHLDSLNLSASITIERLPAFKLGLNVQILNGGDEIIASEILSDLKGLESEPQLSGSFFPRIYGKKAMDLSESHQNMVERIEQTLFTGDVPKYTLSLPFTFTNAMTDADPGTVSELTRTLKGHFAFAFNEKAGQAIRLTPEGSLEFRFKNGTGVKLDSMVDAPAMVDRYRAWDVNSFTVLLGSSHGQGREGGGPAPAMVIPFSQVSDQFPALSETIRREIDSNLAQAYGKNMGPPDFDYLKKVFQGKETRILKGRLINPKSDIDSVNYSWATAETYLNSLQKRVEKGQRFEVGMTLLRLYQDKPNSGRFWGIVSQTWTTRFLNGSAHYRDDGILFVNFDFKPGVKALENFRIYYRFWFYKYKQDIMRKRAGKEPVLVTRRQRMHEVITATLDQAAPLPPEVTFGRWDDKEKRYVEDAGDRGVSGVDMDLLKLMRDDLMDVMQ